MIKAGVLVALEGIDGSGKGTQARLLRGRCESSGISCATIGFPQYGRTPFSQAITDYLNGAYGSASEVHPKLVSILFAADRFASKEPLASALKENALVVCDRYVASNMAHQAAKLPEGERREFVRWLEEIEYGTFGLPQADLTVLFDMPANNAQQLVRQKPSRTVGVSFSESGQGGYTALQSDIHEADAAYLEECRNVYRQLCEQSVGGKWKSISAVANGEIRGPNEIADEVWEAVSPLLTTSARQ